MTKEIGEVITPERAMQLYREKLKELQNEKIEELRKKIEEISFMKLFDNEFKSQIASTFEDLMSLNTRVEKIVDSFLDNKETRKKIKSFANTFWSRLIIKQKMEEVFKGNASIMLTEAILRLSERVTDKENREKYEMLLENGKFSEMINGIIDELSNYCNK